MNLYKVTPWLLSASVAFGPALHAAQQKTAEVHAAGTTSLLQGSSFAGAEAAMTAGTDIPSRQIMKAMPKPSMANFGAKTQAATSMAATGLTFGGFPIAAPDNSFVGFDGIDSTDSAKANGFTVEPPDQGMATNGTQVLEIVNLALQAFSTTGSATSSTLGLYRFFGISLAANTDGTYNQLSDPRTFFDAESGHWFITILKFQTTAKGAPTGASTVLVAASQTSDLFSSFYLSTVDVSDATFGACPCLGDQPLVGINQDGLFISTNEFSNKTGAFQGALVTAVNKMDLVNHAATVRAAAFDGLSLAEGTAFTVQPAVSAPGTSTSANLGTEFFVSSLDFRNSVDNRLAVWSMTNTKSLNQAVPNLNFQMTVINTQEYGAPLPAVQRAGAYPQGQGLGDAEERIDTGDDRMEQVYYSAGKLYCALNTVLLDPKASGTARTGAAWFAIKPDATYATLSAKVASQGLVGIADGSVFYPSFVVNGNGDGVIAFSLTGKYFFPSTAYVDFHAGKVSPEVHLAGIGQAADDGFTGYPQYTGGDVARWGDYSAATVSPNGDLWMASEYIPNPSDRPRTTYTNWGTYIYMVK